nr:ethanolamine ammonia-lyase light chain EutC [uncultured Cohaesibacter sp.]
MLDDTGRLVRLGGGPHDIVFVVVEGLSASAVEKHAPSVLTECLSQLSSFEAGSVILVEQARVAFGDEVGEALSAQIVVVLIGERRGLSTPSSLGAPAA